MNSKPFALSVKALIRNCDDHYLILQRSASSRNNKAKWDFPGGKVDPGESFACALEREVQEETGLEIEIERPAGCAHAELADRTVVYLIMEARCLSSDVILSSEHSDCQWVKRTALAEFQLCSQFVEFARSLSHVARPA